MVEWKKRFRRGTKVKVSLPESGSEAKIMNSVREGDEVWGYRIQIGDAFITVPADWITKL